VEFSGRQIVVVAHDSTGTQHQEVVASLTRDASATFEAPGHRREAQFVLLVAVAVLAVGLVVQDVWTIGGSVLVGSAALFIGMRPSGPDNVPLEQFFDAATGLPNGSALPVVVDDERAMVSLTGRVAVLVIDIAAARELVTVGDQATADALVAAVLGRLEGQALVYATGGSFSSLLFREDEGSLVMIRRDVLGDESNQWLADLALEAVKPPVRLEGRTIRPGIAIGGAAGAASEAAALVATAFLARTEARQCGPGTVIVRSLEPAVSMPVRGIDLVVPGASTALGRWYRDADMSPRVGIFEHLGGLRMALGKAIDATVADGPIPFVRASVTSLCHPRAVAQLTQRVQEAEMSGRVGIVLGPDFPAAWTHRAVQAVAELHAAGFRVAVDRIAPGSRVRALPHCPIDTVIVGTDLALRPPSSAIDRALLDTIAARRLQVACPQDVGTASQAAIPRLGTIAVGAPPSGPMGQKPHLAKVSVPLRR